MKVSFWLSAWCALLFLASLHAADSLPRAIVHTSEGDITVELNTVAAPLAVAQFQKFVTAKVYNGSTLDQAPDGNEVQGGKPGPQSIDVRSTSGNFSCTKGAPGEFSLPHTQGALVFARTVGSCNPNKTNNSTQFCIYLKDKLQNENEFTVFGRVFDGMNVATRIADNLQGKQPKPAQIFSVELVKNK